jgi:esterase/lipase
LQVAKASSDIAWNNLVKNLSRQDGIFLYLQSGDDELLNEKFWNLIIAKHNASTHLSYLEKGGHNLSLSEDRENELFQYIQEYLDEYYLKNK